MNKLRQKKKKKKTYFCLRQLIHACPALDNPDPDPDRDTDVSISILVQSSEDIRLGVDMMRRRTILQPGKVCRNS